MRCHGRTTALLALLLASCVTPVEEQTWIRVTSRHFELLSNAGEARTVEIAGQMERFRAIVEKLTGVPRIDPVVPTRIFVFGSSRSFSDFRWRSTVAGYVAPSLLVYDIAIDASASDEQPMVVPFHEYVHFVLRNQGSIRYPMWWDEGFAEYLSTIDFSEDDFLLGRAPAVRVPWVLRSPMSVERVMTAAYRPGRASTWEARFYASAWALVHYLHHASVIGLPNRLPQAIEYLGLFNRGAAEEDAVQRAFGCGFDELEGEFRTYLEQTLGRAKIATVPFSLEDFPAELSTTTHAAEPGKVLVALGELQLRLAGHGREHLERAHGLFTLALAEGPDTPRALVGLAWAQGFLEGLDEQLLERALEAGRDDVDVQVRGADLLLAILNASVSRMPEEVRTRFVEQARTRYRRALELSPGLPAALAGLGETYLFDSGDPMPGIRALEQAREQVRWNTEVAFHLGRLYRRRGYEDRARRMLQEVALWSHDTAQGRRAAALLDELEAGATE